MPFPTIDKSTVAKTSSPKFTELGVGRGYRRHIVQSPDYCQVLKVLPIRNSHLVPYFEAGLNSYHDYKTLQLMKQMTCLFDTTTIQKGKLYLGSFRSIYPKCPPFGPVAILCA